jgi:hypothetical protein
MWLIELLIALVLALVLGAVLVVALGRKGPGPASGLLFFALLLFVLTWAGGVWISPTEADAGAVNWLGFLAVGVVFALLLAALVPPVRRSAGPPPGQPASREEGTTPGEVLAIGVFFWVLLLAAIAALTLRYWIFNS